MLNKTKKKKYKRFDDKENRAAVKQLKDPNSLGKRVDIPPDSQNLFMKAVKENSPDEKSVSGHETLGTNTGMFFK